MSPVKTDWLPAGSGVATRFAEPVEGDLVEVKTPEDVLVVLGRMDEPGWTPPLVVVHEAGGTTVGPLLGNIVGVISTKGTLGAHVALLAMEYGCPCVVGAKFDIEVSSISRGRIDPDGTMWAVTEG